MAADLGVAFFLWICLAVGVAAVYWRGRFLLLEKRYMEALIDTAERLAVLVRQVERAAWVAVDTEADSLYSYPEKLCLLQISLPGQDELVDPLAGMEMEGLRGALGGHHLILHGGDYDLRLLYRSWGFVPKGVFDTMLAARLVGMSEFGLEKLVSAILGVKLEKGPQRANWARRPLTDRMLAYARNDSRHLKPLADRLLEELRGLGRQAWHEEMCERLVRDCAQDSEVDTELVWRISGAHRLDRRGLAVLRALWHWRDREARRLCRPPYFVLPHDHLVRMAEGVARGQSIEDTIPRRTRPARRTALLGAVAEALALPDAEWPKVRRPVGLRLSSAQRQGLVRLQQRRDRVARELQMDPSLLGSRSVLVGLASGRMDPERDLMSWQRKLLLG
jgi:ribonuclease D